MDDLGTFSPADVRPALSRIMHKTYDIQQYLQQLTALCKEGRGAVLHKSGERWRPRYRFTDPLLTPFVILKGLEEGLVRPDQLTEGRGG